MVSEAHALPQYDPPPGIVALGTEVEVELISRDGDAERLTFDIVPEQAADFDAGFPRGHDPACPGDRRAIRGCRSRRTGWATWCG